MQSAPGCKPNRPASSARLRPPGDGPPPHRRGREPLAGDALRRKAHLVCIRHPAKQRCSARAAGPFRGPAAFRFAKDTPMTGNSIPMTKAGADAIKRELKRLKSVERPRIVQEISTARDHGDLSENAEYHAAKEKQSHIEGRIQMLEDRLARGEIIDVGKLARGRGVFGVRVK